MGRINSFERFQQNFKKNYAKVMHEAKKIVDKEMERQLIDLVNSTIDDFYNNYNPEVYTRPEPGMYELLKFKNKEDGRRVMNLSSERMGYDPTRSEALYDEEGFKDYLFSTVFIDGFHGGASDGEKHPDPGTPYYRKPIPYERKRKRDGVTIKYSGYYNWGRPAESDESPDSLISAGVEEINKNAINIFNDAFESCIGHMFD